MAKDSKAPLTLFYSYAHEDELFCEKLEKHLSLLQWEEMIVQRSGRMIIAGMDWAREIDRYLASASLILLLISPDFMASEHCYGEMERALELGRQGRAHVIPILLRPMDWEKAPFAQLDCLPLNKRPITLWQNEDEAFLAVARGIRDVIEHLRLASTTSSEPYPSLRTSDRSQEDKEVPSASHSSRAFSPSVSKQVLYKYDAHADKVITVGWSPDGTRIASGGLDSTVHVWKATGGQHLLTYRGHSRIFPPSAVYVLRWSPDSSRIASAGSASTVQVWDAKNGQRTALYEGHANFLPSIFWIDWSPDGCYIASTNMVPYVDEEVLHIWEASNGRRVLKIYQKPQLLKSYILGGSWSPDGQRMAINWGKKVYIYQSLTTRRILTYEDHDSLVARITWSPDGKYLASADNRRVHIWLSAIGVTVFIYVAHMGTIRDIAWSPDGRYLASASEDKTVRIWEAITGKQRLVYAGHTDAVTAISWSPDGTCIASASNDKTVHVWKVPPFV